MARHTIVQVAFGKVNLEKKNGGHSSTYSYYTGGLELEIGDRVVVPDNWAHPYEQLATVVAFGRGDYNGALQTLVGKVEPARPEPPRSAASVLLEPGVTSTFLMLLTELEKRGVHVRGITLSNRVGPPALSKKWGSVYGIPIYEVR